RRRTTQYACEALVDERHAHPPGRERLGQRRDERRVGDHERGLHRVGQVKQALEADRLAHEQGDGARSLRPATVAAEDPLRPREGAQPWVFYEGPPTANGPPGAHHVLSRVFKDIYPRFKTMCGYRVERKGGWDCHGLPVEISVEKELGIRSKAEIEEFGIREFNERCRKSVFAYVEEWNRLTERIG